MKLTKENIRSIDTYLKNSEVEFADIRMEMVDHVSTAIEERMHAKGQKFYDAFKSYMAQHKKELQKTNKKFIKTTDIKVMKAVFKKLMKPAVFAIIPLGYLLLIYLDAFLDLNKVVKIAPLVVVLIFVGFYFRFFLRNKKLRFSGIERTGLFLLLPMQILQVIHMLEGQDEYFIGALNLNYILVSFFLSLTFAVILVFIDYKKEYDVLIKQQIV